MSGAPCYSLLMEVGLKSVVVLGVSWVVALFLRRRSAAVRHLLWSATFLALLALPFLSLTLPKLRVPVPGVLAEAGPLFQTSASTAAAPGQRQLEQLPVPSGLQRNPWTLGWRILLLLVWAAGASLSLAQLLAGWLVMRRFRRRANPFAKLDLVSLIKPLGIDAKVDVLQAPEGSMPMAYGLFRAAIFLPAGAALWSGERLRVVLLHELAHVRRGDSATHLMARIGLSLYWWNPLAWTVWHEFLKERERAADDLVLGAGALAPEYADHLLEIARSMHTPGPLQSVGVAMARRSQLEGRLLAILDASRDRRASRRASLITVLLVAIGIVSPLAAMQAKSGSGTALVQEPRLLRSGDAARERGQYEQARAFYKQALAADSRGAEAAITLIHLGTVELATKQFERAIADFEQAPAEDSQKTGEARMWMAIAQERQNNLDTADALYQSALAAEDPNSAAAAVILELHAQLSRQQGREDEANAMRKQASELREARAEQMLSAMPPSGPDVYRVGKGVSAPILVSKVDPKYTGEARIAKYGGTVILSVEIGADGVARNIQIVRGLGFGLDRKAIEAIGQWKFKPGIKEGQPVAVTATIEVNFNLV